MMSLYQMIILSSTRLLRIISGVNMCEVVEEAPASLVLTCLTSLVLDCVWGIPVLLLVFYRLLLPVVCRGIGITTICLV